MVNNQESLEHYLRELKGKDYSHIDRKVMDILAGLEMALMALKLDY
ncbi:hypothetical protein [Streptococcus mitis]|nr:hypothetical protein [Streptococcus mitis]